MNITKFLTATAVGGLISAVPAYAQDVQDEESIDDNVIIVTATKREQTLQEIPVAVSVTSAEDIAKAQVRDLNDLQTIAPTLRVNQLQSSANTNFIIRGFGNGANNAGIEPSVGVFIDGVYRSRSAAAIGDLPNLQRVEVLRGPQSTLFGKNASAGVISIVTQKPQFDFGGSAELSYGNFNAIIAKADITGPISDTIAFSLAGNLNKRDGYADDLNLGTEVNERNRYGFRGQLLAEPSDDLSVRLIADYDKIDEDCCVAANLINGPTGAIVNALAGGVGFDAENPFSYDVYTNLPSENEIENYGISAQIDYDLGAFSLTSITAYRGVDSFSNQDSDFTSADLLGQNINDTEIRTFTQELRIASDFDGPINFLLGGYYFNENIDIVNDIEYGDDFRAYGNALLGAATGGALNFATLEGAFGGSDFAAGLAASPAVYANQFFASGTGYDEVYTFKNEAFSIFGTVDFEITDGLVLTGGLNYTNDRKNFSSDVLASDAFAAIDFDAPQYTAFREQLLLGAGVDAGTAAFLAANPTVTLPDGSSANPLDGLRAFQFQPPLVNLPNSVEDGRTKDDKLTYTARLAYEVAPSLNVYVSYATGFKASSINLSRDSRPFATDATALGAAGLLQPNQTFGSRFAAPENATVYEIGIKGQWDVAAFNLTFFEQSIKGFQSNVFNGTGFELANAGEQSTKGIEFDGNVKPIDGLTLSVAMVYLDPVYDSFPNSINGDISGTTPSTIPALSTTLGVDYDIFLSDSLGLNLRADYHYESKVNLFDDNPNDPAAINFTREVNALNASATLTYNEDLKFTIWGRNLTGAEYLTTAFPSVGQAGSFTGYPNQPRTYGVSARYKF
ncbi:TonB-dependent receptor [Parasphingorhabdus sp.]|uniref:TonB-dependent receptor n=1 Tax=Parasphingorhabdus sp. TaxID=2709688 RepID=UPI003BB1EE0E